MPVRQRILTQALPVLVWTDDLDADTIAQLTRIASLPFVHHHVAAMPDAHLGIGTTVGAVIATRSAVLPAAVGVDIGCGMLACRLSLTADRLDAATVQRLYADIVRDVPSGRAQHSDDRALLTDTLQLEPELLQIVGLHPAIARFFRRFANWKNQIGTLGGGNHFIELCLDEDGQAWVLLHAGSRGIGNAIGHHFIDVARREMAGWMIDLPDRNLAYLPEESDHFSDYMRAVDWAQRYAATNRKALLRLVLSVLRRHLPDCVAVGDPIDCQHNYVAREHHYGENVWVTRKGAIRARRNDLGIVAGSMGQASCIVRGRGQPDSFMSCSHGTGRRISRQLAGQQYTEADLIQQTQGIVCRKDSGLVDELPCAYRDMASVMANQADLVDIVHTLRQVLCAKG